MAYCGALAGAFFFSRQKINRKNYSWIRAGQSLLLLSYIGYFIFNLAYFRLPLGDDVIGQFFNAGSLYFDDPNLRQIGEQITSFSASIKNAWQFYQTIGSRMVGYILLPFLSIFGQVFTAFMTSVIFIGVLLLIVKNIYINDNPLMHPFVILLGFLIVFYYEPVAGYLLMWIMASIYVLSILLLLAFLVVLRRFIELQPNNQNAPLKLSSILLINGLGFISGITHEVYSPTFFIISFLLIAVAVIWQKKDKRLFLLLIGLGLGVATHFLAPGNFVRLANSHDAVAFSAPLLARTGKSFKTFIITPLKNEFIYALVFAPLLILYFWQLIQRIRARMAPALEDILLVAALIMVLVWGVFPYAPGYGRIGFMSLTSIALLIAWEKADLFSKYNISQWRQYFSFYLVIFVVASLFFTDMHWLAQLREYSMDWRYRIEKGKSENIGVVCVPKFPEETSNRFTIHNINNRSAYESDYFRRYYGVLIVPY